MASRLLDILGGSPDLGGTWELVGIPSATGGTLEWFVSYGPSPTGPWTNTACDPGISNIPLTIGAAIPSGDVYVNTDGWRPGSSYVFEYTGNTGVCLTADSANAFIEVQTRRTLQILHSMPMSSVPTHQRILS